MNTLSGQTLTRREQEVLKLVAAGHSNKAIAKQLFLSQHTVAWYVQQIFGKLNVNRRTQAVAVARQRGLLDGTAPQPAIQSHTDGRSSPNLPSQLTSFVGRESEIDDIITQLQSNDCHLLTLVGPGGIGKTRLAIEVATRLADQFADGVYFVGLQALTLPENILPSIASSLGIQLLSDRHNQQQQLIEYCQNKTLLLIMDNFEHVIEGGQIISNLLSNAPHAKILATSRTSLNLYEEHLYSLYGLQFPDGEADLSTMSFSAIDLFIERAISVYPSFQQDENLIPVAQICQLVDGIPLALELAASWLKTLSCKEIAAEIEQGLDILTTPFRNIPERHRSMQAVFDYSWQLLTEKEQVTFRRLSVFRGGCTYQAALYVTGATRQVLQSLVDKSFIRRDPEADRYDIHELMCQYGAQQLEKEAGEVNNVIRSHSTYYMGLLAQQRDNVTNLNQLHMMATLEPDLDNIRVAWHTAVLNKDVTAIDHALNTFAYFHVFRSRFLEEAEVLEQTIQSLSTQSSSMQLDHVLAALYSYCGWIYIRIGEYDQATSAFLDSRELYKRANQPARPGWGSDPLTGLTLLSSIQGNYEDAEKFGEQARTISAEQNDRWNLQLALYCSTSASFHQGKYEIARAYAEQALDISQQSGDQWFRAIVLNDLGNVARVLGDYTRAKAYYHQSLALRQQFKDTQGIAAALSYLGQIAIREDDAIEAEKLYRESFERYRDVGDRGGMGYALCGLGTNACQQGNDNEAHRYFYQALAIASEIQYVPFTFAILNAICPLLLHDGFIEPVVKIIAMTRHHNQSDSEARQRANQLKNDLESQIDMSLTESRYHSAWQQGAASQPAELAYELLTSRYMT